MEPRIVLFDLETIPDLQQALENWCDLSAFTPRRRPGMSASVTSICSFGYRILGEKKSHGINAWDFSSWKRNVNDDSELCASALSVIENADALVSFNGKRFDEKFFLGRLAINGLSLPRKIVHIDLCQAVSANLFLLNGRLKTVAKYLLNDEKLEHEGWPLWVKVHGGVNRVRDVAAEKLMSKYNLKDVDLMVPLFKILRPRISNIPNFNLFQVGQGNKMCCPKCGSTRIQSRGFHYTKVRAYRNYWCRDCDGWSRTDAADRNPRGI